MGMQPKLRFKGFTDDWEKRKATELFKPISEKGHPELPVLSVTQDNGVVFRDEVGIDIKYDESTLSNYKVIHPFNFVISLRSFQGGFELSDKLGITSPAYTIFVPIYTKQHSSLYWATLFKTFKFIESLKTVTFGIRDGKSISFKEFGDLKLQYPNSKNEQKCIGDFFNALGNLIAVNQRKVDLLKKKKAGYLQKLFPKNGQNNPELRFRGYTDAWEKRKLNNVADIYDGTHQTPQYTKNGIPFISVENIKSLETNKYISKDDFLKNFKIKPEKSDILMTRIGDIGTTHVVPDNQDRAYYVSLALIKPHNQNSNFIAQYLESNSGQSELWKRTLHVAFPKKINKNEIGEVPLKIPVLQEQTKIGTFLNSVDRLITVNQRKVDLLKKEKKSLLQKMFV